MIIADNDQMRINEIASNTMNESEKRVINDLASNRVQRHADLSSGNLFYRALRIPLIDPKVNRLRPHTVLLAYDITKTSEKVQREILVVLLVIASGVVVMMSAIYLILRRVLLKPLSVISNALMNQEDSLEKLKFTSSSKDEISILVDSYNLLIGRRLEQEEALRKARRYIDSITDEVPVLLAYVDSNKCFKFVNKNFERWFGRSHHGFIGKRYNDYMFNRDDLSGSLIAYADRVLGGEVVDYDYEYIYPVAGKKQVHVTYSPDRSANGSIEGFFICVEDITARVETEKKLEIEKNSAQSASIAKSEFLANMSHELRTPLNSMLILSGSFIQNLEGNLTDEQIVSARYIHSGGEELLEIINDLMDLSKAEAGMLSIVRENTYIHDISSLMQYKFDPVADMKKVPLSIDIADDVPEFIVSDLKRIRQILKNFLSNAYKFTSSGEIKLKIFKTTNKTKSYQGQPKSIDVVAFAVIDSGIGIAGDKQDSIFEAFQQEDGSTSRCYGGTGLGLTIASKLADLLEGYITLSSTHGVGSTFTVYIPIGDIQNSHEDRPRLLNTEPTKAAIDPVREKPVAKPKSKDVLVDKAQLKNKFSLPQGKRALIVDDDMRNVFALSKLLTDAGVVVTIADSGQSAVKNAKTNDYDFVLMDIMMPGMDGFEATKEIRKIERFETVPIIALTAKAMSDDREKCLAADFNDYMAKPVHIEALLMMVEDCIGGARYTN
ncbi:MAG: response regulator [Pseudomonadales bacterium]|nr:response regulator [Pseudomonadales bacterium]